MNNKIKKNKKITYKKLNKCITLNKKVDLINCNLDRFEIKNKYLKDGIFKNCNIFKIKFVNCIITNVGFIDCNLNYICFDETTFKNCNFIRCYFDHGDNYFNHCFFNDTIFEHCNLLSGGFLNCYLKDSDLSTCKSREETSFLLENSIFNNTKLPDYSKANFLIRYKKVQDINNSSKIYFLKSKIFPKTKYYTKMKILEIQNLGGSIAENITKVKCPYSNTLYELGKIFDLKNKIIK